MFRALRIAAKILIPLAILVGGGYYGFLKAAAYLRERNKPTFREAEITRGEIVEVVNATGTIEPVLRVQIGSFVSGPVKQLFKDHTDHVEENELLAQIDPRIYEAAVARDKASLQAREADVERLNALLEQARKDEKRARDLSKENKDFISDTELDRYIYSTLSLAAQLKAAEAAVEQAKANLENSQTNLKYTEIRSPKAGIIIDRKIDEGQTLAAQFQTPVLFEVAYEMDKRMYVFASVNEADIGMIRKAQERQMKVEFTIDAYRGELFEGRIAEVRYNSTTVQNVVTYPVVVEAPNRDLKLWPGMTANISFHIDRRDNVLRLPNAALRFYPKREYVRPEDRDILEGGDFDVEEDRAEDDDRRSAADKAEAGRNRQRRHVWVKDGDLLRAVAVTTGLYEYRHTEIVSGDLKEGQKVVTGVEQ
jgi:HlyD family secretion protein